VQESKTIHCNDYTGILTDRRCVIKTYKANDIHTYEPQISLTLAPTKASWVSFVCKCKMAALPNRGSGVCFRIFGRSFGLTPIIKICLLAGNVMNAQVVLSWLVHNICSVNPCSVVNYMYISYLSALPQHHLLQVESLSFIHSEALSLFCCKKSHVVESACS